MNKKTIMLDMDDVIVLDSFKNMVEEFLGEEFDPNTAGTFYLQDVLGNRKREFFKFFVTKNIYDYGVLAPNVQEVLKSICEKYDVYLTTDYIWRDIPEQCGNVLRDKYNYLIKELPFLDYSKFIFTSSKKVIKCDIRIDDWVENLIGDNSEKYLFTAYHNQNISEDELKKLGIIRVNNWLELKKHLLDKEV